MEIDDDGLAEAGLDILLGLLRAEHAVKAGADRDLVVQLLDLIAYEIKSGDMDRLAIGDRLDGAEEREGRRQRQQHQVKGNQPPAPRDSPEVALALG
ncbi:MAG: hypothetical protein EBR83_00990 [Verrucomicrobia bacterium]|nr:hypothetical protein [Verrucomicrobiota bacterium]